MEFSVKDINFSTIPLLSGLDRIELAKLIPNLEIMHFKEGDFVFRQGDSADALYIVLEGKATVCADKWKEHVVALASLKKFECFGEMALLTETPRSAHVIAGSNLIILKLQRQRFERLIKKHPSVGIKIAGFLSERLKMRNALPEGEGIAEAAVQDALSPAEGEMQATLSFTWQSLAARALGIVRHKTILGLLLAIVSCALSYFFLRQTPLNRTHIIIIESLLAASILWSLNVFNYHAVAVALPVVAVLFGIATPEKAFSGYSNASWFLVLGVFAISAAISKTGLMYRIVLMVLRRFPPSYLGQTFALALAGLILTPVIPSSNGRAVLASPLALNLSETLGLERRSPGSIGIAMSCMLGFAHMSFMFMNGTATCFLALGLLPPDVSAAITWSSWLKVALPLGLFFFLCSYLIIAIICRPEKKIQVNLSTIDAQLKTLGPWTAHEKISFITVAVSILGFMTQQWHHINGAWVAMLSFLILFAGNVLDEKSVRSDFDWNFMISFGALVGFGTLISSTGLTGLIANILTPVVSVFCGNSLIFLLMVSVVVHLLRFVLPLPAALLISILSIMPAVSSLHIHPFVIGLVALISSNPWFLPHQNTLYLSILQGTEGKLFRHEQVVRLAVLHVIVVLVSIAVAVPYWKYLGLLQ